MKHSRRSILRKVSALSALAVGASATASAADCSGVPEWDANTAYGGGDQVTFDGTLFTAEWWTQGSEPDDSKAVWTAEGPCDGDGDDGDGDDGGDDGGDGSADCDGAPTWDASTAYTGGDQVVFEGQLWTAEWWTQGTEPAESENVWTLAGNCGNFAPTASASASPLAPDVGATVTFDGSGSSDQDGSITAYSWAFGDGSSATGETVSHSYGSEGDYTATLTVTDDAGATATDSVTISVGDTGDGGGPDGDKFAPYQGTWGDVPNATLNANTDRVVLSFVGDGTSGDGVNPGWLTSGGQRPLGDFTDEIQTLQDNGVEVWVAMGGWDGRTIARDATNATEVKEAYEEVVDTLGVTHIDIDDENAQNRPASVYEIRNEALAMLQAERPEVKISYTVPAGSGGVENRNYSPAKDMINDAVAQGVDLSYVNIMTMGYGGDYTSFISGAAQGTVDWLANPYPNKSEAERWQMLGVTPNVGESNFDTSDGEWLVDFAEENGMGLLSFWAMYKSSAASQADIFHQFEDGG